LAVSALVLLLWDAAGNGYGWFVSDDETSMETKALDASPGLREALAKTEVFQKLKAAVPQGSIGGKTYYYVEGDLRLDEDQLLLYSRERAAQNERYKIAQLGGPSSGPLPGQLLADTLNGQILRWPLGSTLTYCVIKESFSDEEYNAVVANMKAAGDAWADACNIKFAHKAELDGIPNTDRSPPNGVLFYVKKTNPAGNVIAASFFPRSPRSQRKLVIMPFYFEPRMPMDRVGTLRHELGHILGFRHEHIRSEAPPVCSTGEPLADAIPLTAYDPRSVMHYFCPDGHVGTTQQAITDLDKAGALRIYPKPGGDESAAPDSAFKAISP
jgi:hypothetical protein